MGVVLLKAQDTIIVNDNFTFKGGIKLCSEASADVTQHANTYHGVGCGGIQLIAKIKKSKSSIESGIYYTTKAKNYSPSYFFSYSRMVVRYHYLSIPVNYRYDTKVIYLAGGVFFDYLLNCSSSYSFDDIYNYGIDRKFNIGYNVAIGMEKQISRTINFYVEGLLLHTVSWPKVEKGHGLIERNLKTTFRNYGVGLGVNYKFLNKEN